MWEPACLRCRPPDPPKRLMTNQQHIIIIIIEMLEHLQLFRAKVKAWITKHGANPTSATALDDTHPGSTPDPTPTHP